jgi:hypothetical protein
MVRRSILFVLFACLNAGSYPASGSVFIYTITGSFTSGALTGAHYQWMFQINANATAYRSDYDTQSGFASASFAPQAISLLISNSAADDGLYKVIDSNAGSILIQEMYGPANDGIEFNTGGTPNLSLPSYGPFAMNFVFTIPDSFVDQTPGSYQAFTLFPVNAADVLSVSTGLFPRGPTSTVPHIAMANPEPRQVAISYAGNDAVISLQGVSGVTYRLERKLNIADATWQNIPGVVDVTITEEGVASIIDPNALTLGSAFYRLRLLP